MLGMRILGGGRCLVLGEGTNMSRRRPRLGVLPGSATASSSSRRQDKCSSRPTHAYPNRPETVFHVGPCYVE